MNSDTLGWLKFNSSDLQTNLILAKQSGKKVRIKTVGFRIPLFLQYPNILENHLTVEIVNFSRFSRSKAEPGNTYLEALPPSNIEITEFFK